jgi:hypothetical protein
MYNSGNSSKNVTGSNIIDGAVEAADLATAVNNDIADGVAGKATADLALPKTGGALTGAVTTNSTFDGRDVATDGAALDVLDLAINSAADAVAITVDVNENVGIGTASPTNKLHLIDSTGTPFLVEGSGATGTFIGIKDSSGALVYLGGSSGDLLVQTPGSAYATKLTVSSVGDVTVNTGNLVIGTSGKGIDFSATSDGSGTMTSEVLDDYEEGTFTPGISFSGASVGVVYANYCQGAYTKIGRKVTANMLINISSRGSSTGYFQITGLPFTVGTTLTATSTEAPLSFQSWQNLTTGFTTLAGSAISGSTTAGVYGCVKTSATATILAQETDLANNAGFRCSVTYFT